MVSTEAKAAPEGGEGKRQFSSIEFPYADLDQVKKVVEAVRAVGGSSCEIEQLAAKLDQPSTSGTFKLRVFAARTFGLIKSERGKVTLKELGSRICDPEQAKAAGVEAFFHVQLYKALYEKFKTVPLPPPDGLEAEIVALGVAPKQKATARQVFQRSAKQAGFFDLAPNKLVLPVMSPSTNFLLPPPPTSQKGEGAVIKGNEPVGNIHPFIQGLLTTLPDPAEEWETEARMKWLQAAAGIFDLMYRSKEGGSIIVECKKNSSQ